MPVSPSKLQALRQLLAEEFPQRRRIQGEVLPTRIAGVDRTLKGGLRCGLLTELVSAAPSSGGQSVVESLLGATRAACCRLALVDGADGFDPGGVPPDWLRHLVWVRCENSDQAFAAADILVRDGNYAVIVVDLRGLAEQSLRRLPATIWFRLQRAAEGGSAAVLVQTEFPLVPAAPWRLSLGKCLSLSATLRNRADVVDGLEPALDRSPMRAAASDPLAAAALLAG
jgi:hypothetical protein